MTAKKNILIYMNISKTLPPFFFSFSDQNSDKRWMTNKNMNFIVNFAPTLYILKWYRFN